MYNIIIFQQYFHINFFLFSLKKLNWYFFLSYNYRKLNQHFFTDEFFHLKTFVRIWYAASHKSIIHTEITVFARIRKVLYVGTYVLRPAHLASFGLTGIISQGNYRSLRSPIIIIGFIFRSVEPLVYPILFSTLRIIPSELSYRRTFAFTRSYLLQEQKWVLLQSKYLSLFHNDFRNHIK